MNFSPTELEELVKSIFPIFISYGTKIVIAILVAAAGFQASRIINKQFDRFVDSRDFDPSLKPFFKSLFHTIVKILLLIVVLSTIGIEMTSFVALLGAAGVAIGVALSGTLQNFAGGIVILVLRPFKVGDFVETQGYKGTVKAIQIFHTHLTTTDNRLVILPNGSLASGSLVNYNVNDTRRVDFVFGIGYNDNIDKAKNLILTSFDADTRILTTPAAFVAVNELGDSSVNLVARAWVYTPDYWDVYHKHLEAIKIAFDKEGISIPFPQRDVHYIPLK